MTKIIDTDTQDIKSYVLDICYKMNADNWTPDYVVGIPRGGMLPAVMLSHYLNRPMVIQDVRLRDNATQESNTDIPLDALEGKQILIVDDINDTGATFQWLITDWENTIEPHLFHHYGKGYHMPDENKALWKRNIRFAVLINNEGSEFKDISFSAREINKTEDPSWVVFPWECWWYYRNW